MTKHTNNDLAELIGNFHTSIMEEIRVLSSAHSGTASAQASLATDLRTLRAELLGNGQPGRLQRIESAHSSHVEEFKNYREGKEKTEKFHRTLTYAMSPLVTFLHALGIHWKIVP